MATYSPRAATLRRLSPKFWAGRTACAAVAAVRCTWSTQRTACWGRQVSWPAISRLPRGPRGRRKRRADKILAWCFSAMVRRAPVRFTRREEHSNVKHVSSFAAPYGIATQTIDGNDLPAVFAAARHAIETLRAGDGPYLLECMTFRMAGHYVGDSQQYRSKEELAAIREKCPIERLKRHLIERGVDAEELDAIGDRSRSEVQQAVERAVAAARPDAATVLEYVYRAPALAAIPG